MQIYVLMVLNGVLSEYIPLNNLIQFNMQAQ